MSVALKSTAPSAPLRQGMLSNRSQAYAGAHSAVIKALPHQGSATWFQSLLTMQKLSVPLTIALAASALGIYGWSVCTQKAWSNSYQQLQVLERQERQLTATSAVLHHQIAEQAEQPTAGLVPQTPAQTIFLKPETAQPTSPTQAKPSTVAPATTGPVGY